MTAGMGRTHRYFQGEPLYRFGYGLGYSTFTYSGLIISHKTLEAGKANTALQVEVTIWNNGEFPRQSDETVMVFASPLSLSRSPTPHMSVPRQMLLGFTKVTTHPGRATRVKLPVAAKHMRLLGHDGEYALLKGEYRLHVGGQPPGLNGQVLTASLLIV